MKVRPDAQRDCPQRRQPSEREEDLRKIATLRETIEVELEREVD